MDDVGTLSILPFIIVMYCCVAHEVTNLPYFQMLVLKPNSGKSSRRLTVAILDSLMCRMQNQNPESCIVVVLLLAVFNLACLQLLHTDFSSVRCEFTLHRRNDRAGSIESDGVFVGQDLQR